MADKYEWTATNFGGTQNLKIKAAEWSGEPGILEKNVLLIQIEGSMHFQFSMTPEQARRMAMALIAAAESLA